MTSAATQTAMDQALERLRQAMIQVGTDGASNLTLGVTQSQLDEMQHQYDQLSGDLYQGVLDGSVDSEAWFDAANGINDELVQADRNIIKWNFSNTAIGIGDSFVAAVKTEAKAIGVGAGAGIAIYVLVGLTLLFLFSGLSREVA